MLHKGVQYVLYKPEWLGIFTMARYIYNGWSLYSHINIRIKIKIISGISDLKDSLQKLIDIRSLNIIIIIITFKKVINKYLFCIIIIYRSV